MAQTSIYDTIDRQPQLLRFLFYPRKWTLPAPAKAKDHLISVEPGVVIGCRLHESKAGRPWILLFHGNGEIAADYDRIAPFYDAQEINLAVADYRGYGYSNGRPTFSNMIKDAAIIYRTVKDKLVRRGRQEKLFVMGRSLGSISALELAAQNANNIPGLIIESGFISVTGLIRRLSLPAAGIDLDAIEVENRRMVARVKLPALVIHGRADSLVPYSEGEDLYHLLGSKTKTLLSIPGAEHNNVIIYDRKRYFSAIAKFVASCS